ncbi:hypothetical protein [Arthrobacter sp. NicSoilB8]|uniref:glycosyltransferase family protein n=1 Tax=Arthrobacter sp. NicSoilB8 TaxID=2830998 RepID=UPI001CC5F73F|nr:hypothetical protein [Arthrobacter sp. NicSoilB8]BCW71819.1 hypothetical protein NicSoilB8_28630 [Arthrobacter sp. NicSoilB8]
MADDSQNSGQRISFREEIAEKAALPRPLFRDLVAKDVTFFDQQWYEAQCGQRFDSRADAVRDAASKMKASRFSPHPLFDFEWFREAMRRRHPSVEPAYALLFLPGRPVANPHPVVDLDAVARLHPESLKDPHGVFGWLLAYLGVESGAELPGISNGAAPVLWNTFRSDMIGQAKAWRQEFEAQRRQKSEAESAGFDSSTSEQYLAAMAAQSMEADEGTGKPVVSVIVHGHDTADDLQSALASLHEQASVRADVIVVDQTDGGAQASASGRDLLPSRRLDARNLDTASALNWAVREATGRYVAFLGPGHRWDPRFLQTMAWSLAAQDASHGFSVLHEKAPNKAKDRFHVRFDEEALLSGGAFSLSNWMVEKSLLGQHAFDAGHGEACGFQAAWNVGKQADPFLVPFIGASSERPSPGSSKLARRVFDVWLEGVRKSAMVDWHPQRAAEDRLPGVSAILVWKDESAFELSKTLRSLTRRNSGVSEVVVVAAKTERFGRFTVQAERSLATVPVKFRVVPSASSALLANVGFAESAHDRLLFVRPGTEFEASQVGELSVMLTPGVAAVQPALVDQDGTVISAGYQYTPAAVQARLPFVFLEGHHEDDLKSISATIPAAGASLTAMLVGADAFSRLEGFAADLPERWFDVDYSHRAARDLGQLTLVAASVRVMARKPNAAPSEPWSQSSTERFMGRWSGASTRSAEDVWRGTPYSLMGARFDPDAREATDRWIPRPILRRTAPPQEGTTAPSVIAIKHCAPGGTRGERWGDTFFARQLADAMRELGHHVYVDNRASARRLSTYLDQINIVIRGRYDIPPIPGALNVLWIISHPELVQPEELMGFDLVYAASESWAMWASRKYGVDVRPLLQATDVSRFRRSGASNVRSADVLVVGNRRWEYERPSAKGLTLLETDLNRGIYGEGWAGEPAMSSMVLGEYIDNSQLPGAYAGAKVVLNDHHPSMRQSGFINNRIFDALALGTPVISDSIAGGVEVFGDRVKWYESADEIPLLVRDVIDNPWSGPEQDEVVDWIRESHSFGSRAKKILHDLQQCFGE